MVVKASVKSIVQAFVKSNYLPLDSPVAGGCILKTEDLQTCLHERVIVLKIGDFSKLSRVSVKTLRYYDQVGLLRPSLVDHFSSYRYYTIHQLPRLNRILAYKDLGFSLEQIARLLDEDLPPAQMRGMLRMRQAEIQDNLEAEQARLARIEARLSQIEQEDQVSSQEIIIKKLEPQLVASVRGRMPNPWEQKALWEELEAYLAQSGVHPSGACLTIYHDPEYRESDFDMEVCEPIDANLQENPRVKVYTLPGHESMACILHAGSYENFSTTYRTILAWIEANGFRITGPNREVYLHNVDHTNNPAEYLTEVQFPVQKA